MRASVVVPTRDRPTALGACLAALAAQTAEDVEVVVVDDGSRDAAAVAAVVDRHPGVRLVRGEGRGPAAARNLGAQAATGDLVCFTDDDCRPVPGWVGALRRRAEAGAEAVAGPTRNGRPRSPVATAAQIVTNHLTAATLDREAGTVGFGPTSNVAVRAAVHQRVPFDEEYPLAAGEDRDWCARLAAAGVALAWAPDAAVDHHQDLTLRTFWRQQARYGRGAHRFHGGRGRQPARFFVTLLRTGVAAGPRAGALVVVAQVATAWGLVAEATRRRSS
ncbi:glycosyltransferase [Iamia sp. SCSIO 61187]|uniref:glycosyltransferase family 2 protein n=1 Tax=Iamia sp. SCSIO 61187 TaxID=2722752 RepID=UPI001C635AB7|nr:glycosyltransferase [Iamia sp. SCSIO 61187]QYG92015.1 glycosyltransferase [Iamia sp. SCSIO 61187]